MTSNSHQENVTGRSFRRARTVMTMGALAGTLACFVGATPAMASSPTSSSISSAYRPVVASGELHASAPASSQTTVQADLNAYSKAGYTYVDALDLAALWGSATRQKAKITAGAKILNGTQLPFAPKAGYTKQYTSAQQLAGYFLSDYHGSYAKALQLATLWGMPKVVSAKTAAGAYLLANKSLPIPKAFTNDQNASAFGHAGYGYPDALDLAVLWGSTTVYNAKVRGGVKLLAGARLPLAPKAGYARRYTPAQQLAAYSLTNFKGNHDYYQALRLAEFWGTSTVARAKMRAGALNLANNAKAEPVPTTFTSKQDADAFRLAGYTYADAVKLAQLWHTSSPSSAKVKAGSKLLSVPFGGTSPLPIQPSPLTP